MGLVLPGLAAEVDGPVEPDVRRVAGAGHLVDADLRWVVERLGEGGVLGGRRRVGERDSLYVPLLQGGGELVRGLAGVGALVEEAAAAEQQRDREREGQGRKG